MKAPKIIKQPNPILTKESAKVDIRVGLKTIEDLKAALAAVTWGTPLGLAAPQIGKNYRVFVAHDKGYINPEITHVFEGNDQTGLEGCYSLEDGELFQVTRPYGVILKWTGPDGSELEARFNGEAARVIQHEMDHLDGKLCNAGQDKPAQKEDNGRSFNREARRKLFKPAKNRLMTKKGYRKGVKI